MIVGPKCTVEVLCVLGDLCCMFYARVCMRCVFLFGWGSSKCCHGNGLLRLIQICKLMLSGVCS